MFKKHLKHIRAKDSDVVFTSISTKCPWEGLRSRLGLLDRVFWTFVLIRVLVRSGILPDHNEVQNLRPLIRGRRPRCRCDCYVYRSCLSRDKCPGMLGTSSCTARRSCAKDYRPSRYCISWVGPAHTFIAMQWKSYIGRSRIKECSSKNISYY